MSDDSDGDEVIASLRAARYRRATRWSLPGEARLALWLVLNLEAFDPAFPIDGGRVVPDYREMAVREYGNRAGLTRIIDCLDSARLTPSAATNAAFVREWPELARSVITRGWDLMGHGDFNNRKLVDYGADEKAVIDSVLAELAAAKSSPVAGWLSPGLVQSPATLRYLIDGGVRYVADFVADDVPFELSLGGKSILSVPYSLVCNDKPGYERYHLTPGQFCESVVAMVDRLSEEATPEVPKVACLALHPYLSGTPQRIGALEDLLGRLREREDVWCCTGAEIADRFLGAR